MNIDFILFLANSFLYLLVFADYTKYSETCHQGLLDNNYSQICPTFSI